MCNIVLTSIRLYEILSSWLTIPPYEINNRIWIPLAVASCACLFSWIVIGPLIILMDKKLDK